MRDKEAKLFSMVSGSFLYGTNIEGSDRDFKKVVVPSAREIALQQAHWTSYHRKTNKNPNKEKNKPLDIDIEVFSLKGFLQMAMEGQTVAVEMLFAPESKIIHKGDAWEEILRNKHKLIHSGITSFVGYCQTQAKKYSVKGDRINALKLFLEKTSRWDDHSKLELYRDDILSAAKETPYINIITQEGKNGPEDYLELCNKKTPLTAIVKYAAKQADTRLVEYGKRAMIAAHEDGVDWKALMHAVRVATEAEELLLTGHITLPLKNRDLLLRIRNKEFSFQEVSEMIEAGLVRVEEALSKSTLPKEPDREFWNDFVAEIYISQAYENY